MLDVMEGKVYDKHFVPGEKKKDRTEASCVFL